MAGTSISGQVGKPTFAGSTGNPLVRQNSTGDLAVSDSHARYWEATSLGNTYCVTVNAGAATAFTGGAAGTPLVSLYNPVGSGKLLVLISASIANRVAASAAGSVTFNFWGGVSAANTGTLTTPTNMLSLQTGGSVAKASSNAVTTSTTAITTNGPFYNVGTYYWATAAAATALPLQADIAGQIVVYPGNLVALGGSAALTSATYDVSLIWEEVAIA